jgi:hypothetical protein
MLSAVRAAIARERGVRARLRNLSTRWRVAAAVVSAVMMVLALAIARGRSDLALYPVHRLALITLLYGGAMIAVVRQALWPLQRSRPTRRADRFALGLALALPFMVGMLPSVELTRDISATGEGRDCWPVGLILAGIFIALLRALDRTGPDAHDRTGPDARRTTLLAIAAAALLANIGLLFHCPIAHAAHLLWVHATFGLILLAGLWSADRLAGLRTRFAR